MQTWCDCDDERDGAASSEEFATYHHDKSGDEFDKADWLVNKPEEADMVVIGLSLSERDLITGALDTLGLALAVCRS